MSRVLIGVCLILAGRQVVAQSESQTDRSKLYKVHYAWEIPGPIVFFALTNLGFKRLDETARMTETDVLALSPTSINSFDRPVAFYDPANFARSRQLSDQLLNISVVSPALLLLDKKIRKDWADFLGLYLMANMIDNTLYFAGAFSVRRPRPLTYNPGVSMEDKTGVGKSNSFFSGHTSWSATSMFLIAKVYTDYHHITGWKRIAIYMGAAIPPGFVGYYRMHAGKHFKTDVITGLLIGAACGIGVPELHRVARKNKSISFQPFSMSGARGMTIRYNVD